MAVGSGNAPVRSAPLERISFGLFVAACAAAVPFYLWVGRAQWFFQDEFAVLTDLARTPADLFQPHNEHLIAPARAMYAALWPIFGMHHYLPYQIPVVVAHVALAALLRLVLVRAGVGGVVAAVAALVFLGFGRGAEDIVWAFQITFTGAVLAGYVHLLLALHDGPVGRRDAAGLLAGAVAVASAGPGVVMVVAVGLATWLRRGLRVSLLHSLPLLVPYGAFYLFRSGDGAGSSPGAVVGFALHGLQVTASRAAAGPLVAGLLLVLSAVGLVIQLRAEGWHEFCRRVAAPLSLAAAGLLNWALIGHSRVEVFGVAFAERQRYSHVSLALVLPVVAVGLDGLVRRRAALLVPVLALLLAGLPANLRSVEVRRNESVPPDLFLAVANSPLLAGSSPDRQPFPDATGYRHVTADWLLEARRAGRIPDDELPPSAVAAAADLLSLEIGPVPEAAERCRVVDEVETITLGRGETLTLAGVWLTWVTVPGGEAVARGISSPTPLEVRSTVDGLTIVLGPFEPGSGERCD